MNAYILIAGILVLAYQPAAVHPVAAKLFATLQTSDSVFQSIPDVNTQNRILQRGLKSASLELNLESLSESDSDDQFRLWVGFGLLTPRCFILKRINGAEKATYHSVQRKRAAETALVNSATALKKPKSGWRSFDAFLKSKGVDSTINLTSDFDYPSDDDREIIVIEVRSRAAYEMVFFSTQAKSPDGVRALAVCHRIENDFNVKMGCSGPVSTKR